MLNQSNPEDLEIRLAILEYLDSLVAQAPHWEYYDQTLSDFDLDIPGEALTAQLQALSDNGIASFVMPDEANEESFWQSRVRIRDIDRGKLLATQASIREQLSLRDAAEAVPDAQGSGASHPPRTAAAAGGGNDGEAGASAGDLPGGRESADLPEGPADSHAGDQSSARLPVLTPLEKASYGAILGVLGVVFALSGPIATWPLFKTGLAQILAAICVFIIPAAIVRLHRSAKDKMLSWSRTLTLTMLAVLCVCGTIVIVSISGLPGSHTSTPLRAATRAMGAISGIAFNPNGKVLAASSRDGFTYLRQLTNGGTRDAGTTYDTPPNSLGVNAVAFSPDGSLLASGDDNGNVYLWHWELPYKSHSLLPNPGCGGIDGVAFSRNGRLLAVGCGSGLVYLWQFPSQHRTRPALRSTPGITSVAFSPQGKLLATGNDNGHIYLWDLTGRRLITDLLASSSGGGIYGVAFSHDGALVAAACRNGSVYLWQLVDGHFKKLPPLTAPASSYGLTSVAFSPVSNNLLAAGDANGSVDIWNIAGRTRTIRVDAGGGGVFAVAFSPDGTLVGAGDDLGHVRTWRVTV